MSLYDEKPANPKAQSYEKEEPSLYETVSEQMATLMDFDDSVIYLTTEIDEKLKVTKNAQSLSSQVSGRILEYVWNVLYEK